MDSRRTLAIAAALLALATLLGAFGAHALKAQLPQDRLQVYETAVRYHFIHSLGLLAIGVLMRSMDTEMLRWCAVVLLTGLILFSGSLYLLTFGAPRPIGVVTPVGGLLLMVGWVLLVIAVWRR